MNFFEIRLNDIPRTYRDVKDVAYDAARIIKKRHPGDIIEIVDMSTGEKIQILEDGRIA